MKRTAFFVSDSTGLTAQGVGESLLAQFETLKFEKVILPYVDTPAKAREAVSKINRAADIDGAQPIIVDTIVNEEIRGIIAASDGFTVDILSTFLAPLEQALGSKSSYTVGRVRNVESEIRYKHRIDAVHFAMDNDDGARVNRYDQADLILVGVSRSGKTPTCLYMGLHAGVFAANYPLTAEDLDQSQLPKALEPYRDRLYGLTIDPERLASIREERRGGSSYASLTQCEDEVRMAQRLFERHGISFVDTTHCSVEEIATRILADKGLTGQYRA